MSEEQAAAWVHTQGGVRSNSQPPGCSALVGAGMTPVGLLMGHAIYGLVFALVYGAIV